MKKETLEKKALDYLSKIGFENYDPYLTELEIVDIMVGFALNVKAKDFIDWLTDEEERLSFEFDAEA